METVINLAETIQGLLKGGAEALTVLKSVAGNTIESDMANTAQHNYALHPGLFSGSDALETLTDEIFYDYKGYILRPKIGGGADIAYALPEVRSYLRGYAEQAAQKELAVQATSATAPHL